MIPKEQGGPAKLLRVLLSCQRLVKSDDLQSEPAERPLLSIHKGWRDRLDDAVARSRDYLLETQHPDGYWWLELESNVTITAEYLTLFHLLGCVDRERESRMVRHLYHQQHAWHAAGGWKCYPRRREQLGDDPGCAHRPAFAHPAGGSWWVWGVAFDPDGRRLATLNFLGDGKVWNIEDGQELVDLKGVQNGGYSITYSPDGKLLAAGSNGSVVILDAHTGLPLFSLPGHHSLVVRLSFSPDGRYLATASRMVLCAYMWCHPMTCLSWHTRA